MSASPDPTADRTPEPTVEHYTEVLEAFGDTESLSVLVVAGTTAAAVAEALGMEADRPVTLEELADLPEDVTGWAVTGVVGGVLAIERSGYGDPSLATLERLSADGGAAAVVRGNVQAHLRFGAARDGRLLFDDDEYIFITDLDRVPAALRSTFELAWDDLESDQDEGAPDAFAVGLAMAELVTGIRFSAEQVRAVGEVGYLRAPALAYPGPDEG